MVILSVIDWIDKARIQSSPAINSDGRLEVFVVGTDNALHHKWQTSAGSGSTWSNYQSLGGGVKENSSPAVVRNADGRLDVFVVGTDNSLYHKWQSSAGSSSWSSYSSLSGNLINNPSVILNADGRADVFVTQQTGSSTNQQPTADSKSVTTSTNTPVDITLSGHDPDNDPITFSIVDQPLHGQPSHPLTLKTWLDILQLQDTTVQTSFTYTARDSKGATSISKATVSITVSTTDTGNK